MTLAEIRRASKLEAGGDVAREVMMSNDNRVVHVVHGTADVTELVRKGWLVITILFSFFCSGRLFGELPLGRHDVVIIVAIIAWVGIVQAVFVTVVEFPCQLQLKAGSLVSSFMMGLKNRYN